MKSWMARWMLAGSAFILITGSSLLVPGRSTLAQDKGKAPQTAPTQTQGSGKIVTVIPEAERNRPNPIPATPESIESGKDLYSSQCAMCHGAAGNGKGELAGKLNLKVPDFTTSSAMKKRTDGELHYILTRGHGDMPAETRMGEKELWDMINYVRSLARPKK
jgi:mono/diheme cytochrome c family protein